MKKLILACLLLATVSGCVNVPPQIAVSDEFWTQKDQSVAIVMSKIPAPEFTTIGQQGLLDFAVNEGVNSEMDDYLETLDTSEFLLLAESLRTTIEGEGIEVVTVTTGYELPELPSFSGSGAGVFPNDDYRSLRNKFDADYLLLISVSHAGVVRPYYGFIPTGEPMASFSVSGKLIELETNQLHWHLLSDGKTPIQQPWDEPPEFPNVTTAFYKALAQAQSLIRNDFRVIESAPPAQPASP